ncbi:hypothetical protein ACFQ10_22260 [Streptomyces indonesiensis]|uniref:HTH iclR-type domain-containing protein n=2 Tax=Streptomyces rhizosphaericus TaxID=114699 RepID=A0ABP4D142_9ACTN
MDGRLAGIGLSMRLFGALGHISRDADLPYSNLAHRAGITSQSTRATIAMLEELGSGAQPARAGVALTAGAARTGPLAAR